MDRCTSGFSMLQPHLDDTNYHKHDKLQSYLAHTYLQPHIINSPFGDASCLEQYASNFQNNVSNLYRGVPALVPYTSHLHTPQNLAIEEQQAGFRETRQLPPITQEKLRDVTSWSKSKELAMHSDENHEGLAVFDHQDQYDINNDDNDDEVDTYNGVNLEHGPRHVDLGATHQESPHYEGTGSCERPLRMYQRGPQSDPKMEKKRQDAQRQRKKRQRDTEYRKQLEKKIQYMRSVVITLRREVSWLQEILQRHKSACSELSLIVIR